VRCSAEPGEYSDEKHRDEEQEEKLRDDDSAADRENEKNKKKQEQHFVPPVLGMDAEWDEPAGRDVGEQVVTGFAGADARRA
jgi:hypothetical protein